MSTRGRRRARRPRTRRAADGPDDLRVDLPPARWRSARRRARAALAGTTLGSVLVWAACCAMVQGLWPPLLLSAGGFGLTVLSLAAVLACAVPAARRVAARISRASLDDLRTALADVEPRRRRRPTRAPYLDVLLGREVVFVRAGRSVLVSAGVVGGSVRVTSRAAASGLGAASAAVVGTYVDYSSAGGWVDPGCGGGGDGGGGGSC